MEERQAPSQQEIDLAYFFRPLGRLWRSIFNGAFRYYLTLTANPILFFGTIVLITGAAFSVRYIIKPSYKTEGIFLSHMLKGKYCKTLLTNLNSLGNSNNPTILAQHLQISTNAAATLKNISVEYNDDTLVQRTKDTVGVSMFTVTLILNDMQYIDSIQAGMISFLENSPYIASRKKARLATLDQLKVAYQRKLKSLDSLKTIVNNSIIPRSQGQGIILGEPINPVSVYQIETYYNNELLKIEESIKLIDNIETLQPFQRLRSYNSPNYFQYLVIGFLISLIAALVITPVFGKKI